MKKLVAILMTLAFVVKMLAVTLAWDASPDANVNGYAIYYGTNSGNWTTRVDVGNVTNCTITLPVGSNVTYFFVATAYTPEGVESLPSNEVSYMPPDTPPYRPAAVENLHSP